MRYVVAMTANEPRAFRPEVILPSQTLCYQLAEFRFCLSNPVAIDADKKGLDTGPEDSGPLCPSDIVVRVFDEHNTAGLTLIVFS